MFDSDIISLLPTETNEVKKVVRLSPLDPNITFKSKSFNYLKIFSKSMSFFLLTPCKTIIKNGSVTTSSNYYRKIIVRILYGFVLMEQIRSLYMARDFQRVAEDPIKLFKLSFAMVSAAKSFCFIYIHSAKQDEFAKLYKCSFELYSLNSEVGSNRASSRISIKGYIWIFLLGVNLLSTGLIHLFHFSSLIIAYFRSGDTIVLQSAQPWFKLDSSISSIIVVSIFLAFWLYGTYRVLLDFHCLIESYIYCFIVYEISCELEEFLKMNGDRMTFTQMKSTYEDLRAMFKRINDFSSNVNLFTVVREIVGLVIFLIDSIDSGLLQSQLQIIWHLLALTISMGFAAQAHVKLQRLGDFISENRERFGFRVNPDVSFVVNEIHRKPLGLNAHAFLITYSFLASMFAAVLTYIFLFLQLKTSNKS